MAGTVNVSLNVTSSTVFILTRKAAGGTTGAAFDTHTRTHGAPGTIAVNSISTAGVTVTTDTSTFDWIATG